MRFFATIVFVLLLFPLVGQGVSSLTGEVKDDEGEPVVIGDAVIYQNDRIVNHSAIVDGIFTIENIQNGSYDLKLSCLGYIDWTQPLFIKGDTSLFITIKEDKNLLEEVTVTALRESIKYENGNVKVNLVNSIFAEQPSTIDALSMMPGIVTDPVSQAISLIGGGSPLLYIGNRNITTEELAAIPVTNIASIEIVYNPSAKYEANGRSVLLITLLKNLDDGIRIELTENIVKRRNFNNYLGYNMSLRKGKFEFRNNFNFNSLNTWEGGFSIFDFPQEELIIENDFLSLGNRPQLIAGTGLHYQISEDDYISINGNIRSHDTDALLTSFSTTKIDKITDSVDVLSDDNEDRDFYTANLNYNKHLPCAKTNVFAGLQWSQYHRGLRNSIFNERNTTGSLLTQKRDQDFDIQVLAGRLDIETQIGKGNRLELGTNIYRGNSNAFQAFDLLDQQTTFESNYIYKENNYAYYGQVIGSLEGIQYTIGLRTESTNFFGKFETESEPLIDSGQTNVFPRVNLSYRIDSLSSINFNFSSSISRPNYLNASSITTYVTPYIEYRRNVNLVPSPARFISINYQYAQQSFNITAYTRNNLVQQSVIFDEPSGRIINSPENFDLERGLNIRINNQYSYKKWNVNTVSLFATNQLKDTRGLSSKVIPYLYLYVNNRFSLPKNLFISFNAYAITARNSGIFKRNGRFVIGASISKRIGSINISLNATDILRNMNFRETYTINDIMNSTTYFGDIKSFSLSMRYSFGKTFKSNYQNDNVDENLDRMR